MKMKKISPARIEKLKKKRKKKQRNAPPEHSKLTREQTDFLDYKDTDTLNKFVSGAGKILPRKRTGTTHQEQKKVASAVKLARFMALMPYVSK